MDSKEKIVVFGPALPMNLAPMWVAHDKGFFREEGLDVDLRPVQGIPEANMPGIAQRGRNHFSVAGRIPAVSFGAGKTRCHRTARSTSFPSPIAPPMCSWRKPYVKD